MIGGNVKSLRGTVSIKRNSTVFGAKILKKILITCVQVEEVGDPSLSMPTGSMFESPGILWYYRTLDASYRKLIQTRAIYSIPISTPVFLLLPPSLFLPFDRCSVPPQVHEPFSPQWIAERERRVEFPLPGHSPHYL